MDFTDCLSNARNAWDHDLTKDVPYIVQGICAPGTLGMSSVFGGTIVAPLTHAWPDCQLCNSPMRFVAMIDLADVPCLRFGEPTSVFIYACPDVTCRSSLYEWLDGYWATYHWRSYTAARGDRGMSWMKVIVEPYSTITAVRSSSAQELHIEIGKDRIAPCDYGWYPEDGSGSVVSPIFAGIKDPYLGADVYHSMVDDFPRWRAAKFCGYPHWRSVPMDAGCECSMRGSLVCTFESYMCPSICDSDVTAWLFLCKHHPLTHSCSIIFQRTRNLRQLPNIRPSTLMLML